MHKLADSTIAAVVPFDTMTPAQQVDHLMHGHGFDEDYGFTVGDRDLDYDEIRELMLSWPTAQRIDRHTDDHDPREEHTYGGSDWFRHLHNKTA